MGSSYLTCRPLWNYYVHSSLRKYVVWKWEVEQQEAFDKAKTQLQSLDVLVHYDPEKELAVSCDACGELKEGSERPVAYPSRTLFKAERNYGHLDKEALALVFAVKKFHQFLYGRNFKIKTDHKPLLGLLHPEKGHAFNGLKQDAEVRIDFASL